MKRRTLSIISFVCALAIITACFAGCGCEGKGGDKYAQLDRSCVFGIDEPILECLDYTFNPSTGEFRHSVENFNLETTAYLAGAIGAKSIRFRFPLAFMRSATEYDVNMFNYLKRASELLRQNGVTQLIGMLDVFPKDTGFVAETSKAVPDLNDAHYKEWMESVYLHTKTIVALFPEIKMWEMGNEMNSEVFFHPNGYDASGGLTQGSGGFEWDEHVKVYTDYMYYMTKGIHEVNPQNVAFTGGYAFKNGAIGNYESIAWFIEDTYSLIKSGSAPTTLPESARSRNPRDFFDGLSWHPYATKKDVGVDERWLDGNNMIYKVAIDNGDEGIPVIFTEFGFHATEEQTELYEKEMEWMETAYEYMLNDMPYVVACCAFRLYRCKSRVSWGGSRQDFWGYFSEDLDGTGNHPREKAYRLQAIYGGTGDLNKYAFCSVRFDTNGGNPVKPQKISVNGKVIQPAAITRKPDAVNEYEFDGWYYGDRKWNFETDTVKGNMTLTARWKISNSYTNEFLPSGIV